MKNWWDDLPYSGEMRGGLLPMRGRPASRKWYDNEPEDPRRDCPWKCRKDDPECICARVAGQGALKP